MNGQPIMLLVEDDDGNAYLAHRLLRRCGVTDEIIRAKDGQEALDFIRSEGHSAETVSHPVPRLILLDINMPRLGGVEVLRQLKSSEQHKAIPIVMLTSTDDPREVERCYQLGCNAYITKPVDLDEFLKVIEGLVAFLNIITTPMNATPMNAGSGSNSPNGTTLSYAGDSAAGTPW